MRFGVLVFLGACGFETQLSPARDLDAAPPSDARLTTDAPPPTDAPLPKVCAAAYVTVMGAGTTSKYRRVQTPSLWTVGKANCEADGGHLVIPETTTEAIAVGAFLDPLDSDPYYWAGILDPQLDGTWTTVTNQPFPTITWGGGDPDKRPGEIYMLVRTTGAFYDWFSDAKQEFVCECTP
ncbi:MAG TPA: C-type lectin domain-containing protein [Kofleriaceae bacterium]|nr:C-type lectin domain-containing protein [Kofleriaceae bacterium]